MLKKIVKSKKEADKNNKHWYTIATEYWAIYMNIWKVLKFKISFTKILCVCVGVSLENSIKFYPNVLCLLCILHNEKLF